VTETNAGQTPPPQDLKFETFGLNLILHMLHTERKTTVLLVAALEKTGYLAFKDGEIIDAQFDDIEITHYYYDLRTKRTALLPVYRKSGEKGVARPCPESPDQTVAGKNQAVFQIGQLQQPATVIPFSLHQSANIPVVATIGLQAFSFFPLAYNRSYVV
jgi:hypothetical protein